MLPTSLPDPMSQDRLVADIDMDFYRALGTRIAEARKSQGMTQVQLSELIGIPQQTLAHYEVGRTRVPADVVLAIARVLAVPVESLMGEQPKPMKRGPAPKLLQQVERIQRLPKAKQRFVMEMLDTVLAQASHSA